MARIRKIDFSNQRVEQDEPRSLLKTLELQGNFKAHSALQLQMAERLYVKKNKKPEHIAALIAVPAAVIRKWALQFGWEELRAEFEYKKWKKISAIARRQGINLDDKYDRVLGTLDTLVERMLLEHAEALDEGTEEGRLRPQDLVALASVLKTTRGERRDIRGEKESVTKHQVTVDVQGNVDIMHKIGVAIADVNRQVPLIESARDAQVRALEDAEDAEFELLED